MLDLPHLHNEEGIQYLTKDLQGMVHFLEGYTGKKLDYDRLKEILRLGKEAYDLFYEIGELRKAVPTPVRAREAFRNFSVWSFLLGKQEAVDYFRVMRDEIKRRVENKEGAVADEKFRIVWLYIPPNYALNVFDWMETEYGATIPMDAFNFMGEFEWDLDNPLETLAKKMYHSLLIRLLGGPIENTTGGAVKMVKDYKADGAIWLTQIGCKQGCAVIRRMKDVLQEELGVPFLSMDGDVIDPSILPPEELKSKLEGFFEILEDRVAVRK
jgi:benzoyl-CoA reductase/2-hydroxyglutaryl-CoA dehydratase subunit BcrC/BadD/HgdB